MAVKDFLKRISATAGRATASGAKRVLGFLKRGGKKVGGFLKAAGPVLQKRIGGFGRKAGSNTVHMTPSPRSNKCMCGKPARFTERFSVRSVPRDADCCRQCMRSFVRSLA